MTTFEKLDAIADTYSPLLLLILLFYVVSAAYKKNWLELELLLFSSVLGLGVVYGLMFLDKAVIIWERIGLDYSTHTAFAVCLVFVLAKITRRFTKSLIASLVLYVLLMLYQKYHTLADVVTTALVISVLLSFILFLRRHSVNRLRGLEGSPG
ncbi:hypothetical protein ACFL2V_14370 [Pseudomonadota bacterium]